MPLKTSRSISFPEYESLPPVVKIFALQLGALIRKMFIGVYEDLVDLQFALRVEALPTASVDYRGRLALLKNGAGAADTLHVCIKNAADTYEWMDVTIT